MNKQQRDAIRDIVEAFVLVQDPQNALAEIIKGTVRVTRAKEGHIVDMKRTRETGVLHEWTYGTEVMTPEFEAVHARLFAANPILPVLPKITDCVCNHVDVLGAHAWHHSEYYNEIVQPFDLKDVFLLFPRQGLRVYDYGFGFAQTANQAFSRNGARWAKAIEPILGHGLAYFERWRNLCDEISVVRRKIEDSRIPLALVRGNRILAMSVAARNVLHVGAVPDSRNIILAELLETVRVARAHGAWVATLNGVSNLKVRLEMKDLSDPIQGRATLVRLFPARPTNRLDELRVRARSLGLTARQADVVIPLVAGRGDKEIARALSMSVSTARVHVREIYARLGVANRVQALNLLGSAEDGS